MSDKKIRVAIYARVSTQEQANEGTSLEYQNEQLTKYCEAQGCEVVNQYVDPGHSGKDDDRPGLRQLMADAKLGLFSKVVVYKLDRLARKLRLMLELEEKLKEYGIGILSVRETIDTSTSIGKTVFQVLGLVAEWEREAIIERTSSGRLQRYREGCWGSGNPPYGYSYNSATKKLKIDKVEAKIIRLIYTEYTQGKSMAEIANTLNNMKIATRRGDGKGWLSNSVREILWNPAYKGNLIVNIHKGQRRKKGRFFHDIPQDAMTIDVPPIVSEQTWDIAQERRKNNKHLQPPRNGHWLLQGLITCGLCGYSLRVQPNRGKRYYSCRGRLKYAHIDGSPRCELPRIPAELLESAIWTKVETILNDPNKLEELLYQTIDDLKNRETELSARIKPIDERLAEITRSKSRLASEWVQTNMVPTEFEKMCEDLNKEEARLRTIRLEHDPAQIEELEHTRQMLALWQRQSNALAWNLENEDGHRDRVVDRPHELVLKLVGLDNKELSKAMFFPASRREILDRLQVRVVVFMDGRVEIKMALLPDPIECQLLQPNCRSVLSP